MNELTIHSRKLGRTFHFWMPADGGYVRLVSEDSPGTLGEQISEKSGSTIEATPENFERKCRAWYRKHLADMVEMGFAE